MPDPSPGTFRARAEHGPDGVLIRAEGELDLVGAPALAEVVAGSGNGRLILDLGDVGFMDSSGLRALIEVRQACLDAGRPFAISRPSAPVMRVLELVDLDREFEVVDA